MLDDRIRPLDADSFNQWQLSTFEKSMLITAVYLGVAIGSYLQIYSDRCGRYSMIFWDTAFQTTFGYYLLSGGVLKLLFFYGIGISVSLTLSASYITYISPPFMQFFKFATSPLGRGWMLFIPIISIAWVEPAIVNSIFAYAFVSLLIWLDFKLFFLFFI